MRSANQGECFTNDTSEKGMQPFTHTISGASSPKIVLDVSGNISASQNVSASYYYGDGRFLTGITASGGSGDTITIVRDIPVQRLSDFPSAGPFNVETLNTELDKMIGIIADREDETTRSIKLTPFTTLPLSTSKHGMILFFNILFN